MNGSILSIFEAYSNLTRHPLALVFLIVSSLSLVAEQNGRNGPFDIMNKALQKYINDEKNPAIFRTVAALISGVVGFVLKYKGKIFYYFMILVIPLTYLSDETWYVVIFLFVYISIANTTVINSVLIIQLGFVYFSLPSSFDRLMVVGFFVFLIFGSSELFEMFTTVV